MARKTKVRSDDKGLFVRADGRVFRPGHISAVVRADMTDGGLKAGDEVRAGHVSGTTRCRIKTPAGGELIWHNDYQHQREAEMLAERAIMKAAGIEPAASIRAIVQASTVRGTDEGDYAELGAPGGAPRR